MFKKYKTPQSDKFTVGVFGASGNVGRATIAGLSYYFSSKIHIKAIVRNPSHSQDLANFRGVTVVQGEVGSDTCQEALKGISSLFIIPPAIEDRVERSKVTLKLAKECKVSHVLTISVTAVNAKDTQFGKEFQDLEQFVKGLGIFYTILRLPLFLDNFWIVKHTLPIIKLTIQMGKYFTPVVIADVGVAAAFILARYSQHPNACYTLTSDRITVDQLTKNFADVLNRKIDYELISEDDYGSFLSENGIETWQIKGTRELSRLINEGHSSMDVQNNSDFQKITGQNPTKVKDWITNAREYFST